MGFSTTTIKWKRRLRGWGGLVDVKCKEEGGTAACAAPQPYSGGVYETEKRRNASGFDMVTLNLMQYFIYHKDLMPVLGERMIWGDRRLILLSSMRERHQMETRQSSRKRA